MEELGSLALFVISFHIPKIGGLCTGAFDFWRALQRDTACVACFPLLAETCKTQG